MFTSSRNNKSKILIVDDEPNILRILKCKIEGFKIITASNGKEGLKKAAKKLPDIIITDIMMPVMDGYQMVESLRKAPGCKDIPVIMLTAKKQSEDIDKANSHGIKDYISKPCSIRDIYKKIMCVFERRERKFVGWRNL